MKYYPSSDICRGIAASRDFISYNPATNTIAAITIITIHVARNDPRFHEVLIFTGIITKNIKLLNL